MEFLNAARGVLSILLMISVGIFISKKKILDSNANRIFSTTALNIALPAYMIHSLTSIYTRKTFLDLIGSIPLPLLVNLGSILIAYPISRIIHVPKNRRGTFCALFSFPNTVFVGLPVTSALFGDRALPYALLYYIATSTMFWTLGTYMIQHDNKTRDIKLFSMFTLKNLLSPPLFGFVVALALVFLELPLPLFLTDTCRYIGSMTTPLSMLFIGMTMASARWQDLRFDLSLVSILLGRFVLVPAIVFFAGQALHFTPLMRNALVIQSAMPPMASTSIMAEEYGADSTYAASIITISTAISLATIPVYMMILNQA